MCLSYGGNEIAKRHGTATQARKEMGRILVCTDAAREGLNLQARCHDLIHVDLPLESVPPGAAEW